MFNDVARFDNSVVGRWFWSVDHWLVAAALLLISIGGLVSLAASTAVASEFNVSNFTFAQKHLFFLPIAVLILLSVSFLSAKKLVVICLIGLFAALIMMVLVLFIGIEKNGSARWLALPGFSVQPSELLKPCFALLSAWILARSKVVSGIPGIWIVLTLFAAGLLLLILQPDVGQSVLLACILLVQLFLAGLSIWIILALALGGLGALMTAYTALPHVQKRIDAFLWPENSDNFQVKQSLESFASGGLFGTGPGEGKIKSILPDAHADFVFAVLGEEFGIIACFIVLMLITFIVLRAVYHALRSHNLFILLGVAGILTQFGMQAFINMASSLNMIPTKGMTLPFISYGGSSMMSTALAVGILLALCRHGEGERIYFY